MHLADEARVDQRLGDLHLRPEALVEADLEQDLRVPAGVDHPAGGLDVERQRLLAEHVLAVGGGRDHGLLVEAVGRGHDHGVDVGCREDGLEVVVGPAAEIGREGLGAVAVAVEHRGEGGPLGRFHRRRMAEPHDGTGADQPDPDGVACLVVMVGSIVAVAGPAAPGPVSTVRTSHPCLPAPVLGRHRERQAPGAMPTARKLAVPLHREKPT